MRGLRGKPKLQKGTRGAPAGSSRVEVPEGQNSPSLGSHPRFLSSLFSWASAQGRQRHWVQQSLQGSSGRKYFSRSRCRYPGIAGPQAAAQKHPSAIMYSAVQYYRAVAYTSKTCVAQRPSPQEAQPQQPLPGF